MLESTNYCAKIDQLIINNKLALPPIMKQNKKQLFILKSTLMIYNLCSFSVYFISAGFFLNHIGLSAPPFQFINNKLIINSSIVNISAIIISLIACLLMIASQQLNLYQKAIAILYEQKLDHGKLVWICNFGIACKATIQLTSFYALTHDYFPIPLSLLITAIAGFGLFKTTFKMEKLNSKQKPRSLIKEIFYALSYASCISALYYNTFNHITLSILNQKQMGSGQLLLFLPNIFFSVLFLIGMTSIILQKTDKKVWLDKSGEKLKERLLAVFSGVCVTWKSIINTLSLLSLLSLILLSDSMLLVLSIPLFIVVGLSQFIFFESHAIK